MFSLLPQVCDFYVDCADGSDEADCGNCTFEGGTFCSWTDRSMGSFRWAVGRGSELTNTSGPPTDHTTGTADGQFVYVAPGKGDQKVRQQCYCSNNRWCTKSQVKHCYLIIHISAPKAIGNWFLPDSHTIRN